MKNLKRVSLAIFSALMLTTVVPAPIVVINNVAIVNAATVKINKTKVTLKVENTYKLKITGTTKTVKWTSSNKSVATVSSTGKVTAKKKGTATITATVGGKKYTSKITVSSIYKDGVYEGSGIGFRNGTTTVSVTIKNDKITDIEIVSSEDTPRFIDDTSPKIISEILDEQSSDVDVVSGATYSSNGIMEAVDEALSKAKN